MEHVYYCGKGYHIYLFGIEYSYGETKNIDDAINCEIKYNYYKGEIK